jgi:hypothetical protein
LEAAPVENIKGREDGAERAQPLREYVADEPEERHAAQVAEKQRRIADRGQGSADIRDDEDEEHDMIGAHPELVHPDPRANQDHRRARGADDVGGHRAEGEETHVGQRRRPAFHGEMDATGDDEQGTDEGDERAIVAQRLGDRGRAVGDGRKIVDGHDEAQPKRDEVIGLVPPTFHARRRERHRRDQAEQQPERREQERWNVAAGRRVSQERREEKHGRRWQKPVPEERASTRTWRSRRIQAGGSGRGRSEGVVALFSRADPHHFLQRYDEDLAVPYFARVGRGDDGVDRFGRFRFWDGNRDDHFGHEVDRVFTAAIDVRALSEALDFLA